MASLEETPHLVPRDKELIRRSRILHLLCEGASENRSPHADRPNPGTIRFLSATTHGVALWLQFRTPLHPHRQLATS